MNKQYEPYEIIRGRKYRYDPDFDAYYAVHEPESAVSKWAWIAAVIVLSIVCLAIEFYSSGTV